MIDNFAPIMNSIYELDLLPYYMFINIIVFAYFLIVPFFNTKFKVHCHDNEANKNRINDCPHLKKGTFKPTPYLSTGFLQACLGKGKTYTDPNIQFEEEIVTRSCGSKFGLDWATQITETESLKSNTKKAILFVVPGLTGSSADSYVRNLVSEGLEYGYKAVVYHARGFQVELSFPKEGYLDLLTDLKSAVEHVQSKYPDYKIFAAGNSYGANTLVNYVSRFRGEHGLTAAASIANPYDFEKAQLGIGAPFFDVFLTQIMQEWAKNNEKSLLSAPKHLNLDYKKAMRSFTISGYDEHITRRMLGFADVNKYYEEIGSVKSLKNIDIPLLSLNARDDPILHYSSIPTETSLMSENVIQVVTYTGGHVGWFEGLVPRRWHPKPTIEFMTTCFNESIKA